jgi:Tfp pilus assembly PilM family ATPase
VLLAGTGARLGGLPEAFQARLELPVQLLDVRGQIRTAHGLQIGDDDASALVVPAGLCLVAR